MTSIRALLCVPAALLPLVAVACRATNEPVVLDPGDTPNRPGEPDLEGRGEPVGHVPVEFTLVDLVKSWRYTTEVPAYGWHLEGFDDASWSIGTAPFGAGSPPSVGVWTEWSTKNIWLRKQLELVDAAFVNPHFLLRHDEHAEIYVNGVPAAWVEGHNTVYELVPIGERAAQTLHAGTNEIAVHCHQTSGGQCIDLMVVDVRSPAGYGRDAQRGTEPSVPTAPGTPWRAERARAWYGAQSPLRGCNYLPRTAINSVEMWRAETWDPATIDEELGWAAAAGYNSVRVFLQYVVWKNDPTGFAARLEELLGLADSHGISVMPVFFDDCCFAMQLEPIDGPQDEPVIGLTNSGWVPSPGYSMVQDPTTWGALREFVHDVVRRHREDPRIVVWDVYNEPGPYFDRTLSFPLARAACGWIRELDPSQPLTIAVWGNPSSHEFLELSDVLSIHNYGGGGLEEFFLDQAETAERPVLVTEWLTRPGPGGFADMLPLFATYRVGWYNRGLVAGRTQTYYSRGARKGDPMPDVWMCDVLRADGTPYDPAEIALIRSFEFREQRRARVLLPTSRREPQIWQYTLTAPGDGWFVDDFDDSAWAQGPGGFGTPETPGTTVGTRWDGEEIWLRHTFELGDVVPADPALRIRHDEDVEVYLNGHLVARLEGYNVSYERVPLVVPGRQPFRKGQNVLAIHCRQTTGGQFIDAGIIDFGG